MLDIQEVWDGTFSGTPPTPQGAAITVTRASTNVIDDMVARDMGAGAALAVNVHITEGFATLTSLTIEYQVSADNATFYTLISSGAMPVAQLIAGAQVFRFGIPENQYANMTAGVLKAPGRYSRLYYTVAGSAATTGKVFAFRNPLKDHDTQWAYPRNYTAP
jgi:hypothetical protein